MGRPGVPTFTPSHLRRNLDLGLWLWLNGISVPVPLKQVSAFCLHLVQLPTWMGADCFLHLMGALPPNFSGFQRGPGHCLFQFISRSRRCSFTIIHIVVSSSPSPPQSATNSQIKPPRPTKATRRPVVGVLSTEPITVVGRRAGVRRRGRKYKGMQRWCGAVFTGLTNQRATGHLRPHRMRRVLSTPEQ
jgi:hypothetical protein